MKRENNNEKLVNDFRIEIIEGFNNEEEVLKYQLLMKKYYEIGNEKIKEEAYEIRNRIIEQNLPLVFKLIEDKGYYYQMPIEDLAIIGSIALAEAIDKYQFDKGTKFSSYAGIFIVNSMSTEISKWVGEGSEGYGKALRRYTSIVLNEYNSKQALYDPEVMNRELNRLKDSGYISEKIISEVKSRLLSQNSTMEEAMNVMGDEGFSDRVAFIRANQEKLFSGLTDYERSAIEYLCGFRGRPYQVKEVAEIYGVKHQVISQRYDRAIKKIKKKLNVA